MSDTTKIEWADATFNPWIGCTKVSPGCKNCYAENTTRARVLRKRGQETWGKGAQRSRTSEAAWKKLLQWNKTPWVCDSCGKAFSHRQQHECPGISDVMAFADEVNWHRMRVFPSLCDWLDDEVSVEWLADFLKRIHQCQNLEFLLLTKRPENFKSRLLAAASAFSHADPMDVADRIAAWANGEREFLNVWIGVSVENQEMADKRIPELVKIPAAIRFLSVEPMLGPVDFTKLDANEVCPECKERITCNAFAASAHCSCCVEGDEPISWGELHWVIFGGESHPDRQQARPCNIDYMRAAVKDCRDNLVKVFVKQFGAFPHLGIGDFNDSDMNWNPNVTLVKLPGGEPTFRINLKDKKGGDMSEWPEDLRVREFPSINQR